MLVKILYRQHSEGGLAYKYGFSECCLKRLGLDRDAAVTLRTAHCHREYEIHIPIAGSQTYEYQDRIVRIPVGSLLLIPPGCRHRAVEHEMGSQKLAISFSLAENEGGLILPLLEECRCLPVQDAVMQALFLAECEAQKGSMLAKELTESLVLEVIVSILREVGLHEGTAPVEPDESPVILSMAKGFIKDNIDAAPRPETVALYCHISMRQLSRIFLRYEDVTLFDYIRQERTERIKTLLSDASLSLSMISERMHFANEYYFNTFFKKNYGMTPGAYRKMTAK